MKTPVTTEYTDISKVTYEVVSHVNPFGCANCLRYCAECTNGSKFIPHIFNKRPTCKNYVYFD